ncbi:MAG TPA: CpaD family pilus assembly lipoprotein [Geminicoccaceae bacterium]|nr:CpaD family pilus assembly lipoprotein [Geminicoccaceae bacterium]
MTPSLPEPAAAARRRGPTTTLRRLALCGLLALPPATAACTGPAWDGESPKRLQVDLVRHEHRVHFDTDSAALAPTERERLLAFLRGIGPDGRAVVRLAGHADERHTEAYNLDLSRRRAAAVAQVLRESGHAGVPVEQAAFGEGFPAAPGSTPEAWRLNRRVEVATERYRVTPPDCPDWSRPSQPDFDNRPLPNLGCATATNLAHMVAEPRDLARGRELGPADGIREAEAIVRYREGKVTELMKTEGLD